MVVRNGKTHRLTPHPVVVTPTHTHMGEGAVQPQHGQQQPGHLRQAITYCLHCAIDLAIIFYVLYLTLFHLPPIRFHCVGGFWDRTQDCCIGRENKVCVCPFVGIGTLPPLSRQRMCPSPPQILLMRESVYSPLLFGEKYLPWEAVFGSCTVDLTKIIWLAG
jgi:hypothetical protein